METTNVAWKLQLPAYSGSTPIIWGNTIFLNMATASNTGSLELWAVDRTNQAILWKRPLADGNHMERKQNMSTPSPVTDGKTVWVMTGVGVLKASTSPAKSYGRATFRKSPTARSDCNGATHRRRSFAVTRSTSRSCTA